MIRRDIHPFEVDMRSSSYRYSFVCTTVINICQLTSIYNTEKDCEKLELMNTHIPNLLKTLTLEWLLQNNVQQFNY